jgi:hypothetical protein
VTFWCQNWDWILQDFVRHIKDTASERSLHPVMESLFARQYEEMKEIKAPLEGAKASQERAEGRH